jgi:hypothetical protein
MGWYQADIVQSQVDMEPLRVGMERPRTDTARPRTDMAQFRTDTAQLRVDMAQSRFDMERRRADMAPPGGMGQCRPDRTDMRRSADILLYRGDMRRRSAETQQWTGSRDFPDRGALRHHSRKDNNNREERHPVCREKSSRWVAADSRRPLHSRWQAPRVAPPPNRRRRKPRSALTRPKAHLPGATHSSLPGVSLR